MDNLCVLLGRRRSGKSTLAACYSYQAEGEQIMDIVHDPLGGYPENVGVYVESLSTLKEVAGAGSCTIVQGNVDIGELIAWCKDVSPRMINGGRLTFDEGVLLTTHREPAVVRRELRELAAVARHSKLRICILAQGTMLVDHALLSAADTLVCFALVGQYEHAKLRACGVPDEISEKVKKLHDFHYYKGTPGRPAQEWGYYKTCPDLKPQTIRRR